MNKFIKLEKDQNKTKQKKPFNKQKMNEFLQKVSFNL